LKWMFNPVSPLYIKPRLDIEFMSWVWRFARACDDRRARRAMPALCDLLLEGKRLYEELAGVEGVDFQLVKRGLVVLFNSEKGKRSCEHEVELAHEVGIAAQMLDEHGLHRLDPVVDFRARGGTYFPGDMHLVPARLVKNLVDYLERQGVQLLRNCEVKSFKVSGKRIVSIGTSNGLINANDFVLAAGAWSPVLARDLGLKMHLQAGKGYSITVNNPSVKPGFPYIFQERRVAVTPFADALRFAGTMEFAGIDVSINQRRVEAILDAIPYYFGNIPRPQSVSGEVWKGLRPVTPDGFPYLGRFTQIPNLIAATGHAMLGISLATVTGKVVSDIVQNRPADVDLTLLNPNRYDL